MIGIVTAMRLRWSVLNQLLQEKAMTPEQLPASVKFFETGDNQTHYLYLIDSSLMPDISEALLGGISITTFGGSWHVGSVSAHEGYGPLMYRLAMEWVAENGRGRGLTRNPGETSDAAKRVWQKFDDVRRDPSSGIKAVNADDPMRPEYVARTGELKRMRTRWLNLTPQQSNEAWMMLTDLAIGGQRGYDEAS